MSSNLQKYSMHLASDWITVLLQEYEDEVKEESGWPILLLPFPDRQLVWVLCWSLKVFDKGIPASACRLMERYLARNFRRCYMILSHNWARYKSYMKSRHFIIAACCIQLAAKMTDVATSVTPSLICRTLLKKGIAYTREEIFQTEFHIYEVLGFRLPLWTSSDTAEFLAVHVGLGNEPVTTVISHVICLVEFHKQLLVDKLLALMAADLCDTPGSSTSSTVPSRLYKLHMCAGAVYTAVRFLKMSEDPRVPLAELTRTTPAHINAIADIILEHIIYNNLTNDD